MRTYRPKKWGADNTMLQYLNRLANKPLNQIKHALAA